MRKLVFLVVILAGICGADADARDIDFPAPPVHVPLAGGWGRSVAVADVNGDGLDDAAVIAQHSSMPDYVDLHFLPQRSDGSFGTTVELPSAFGQFLVVASADIYADGSSEMIVGHSQGMTVYAWDGAGFSPRNHPSGGECAYLAIADLDEDDDLDIVCHGWGAEAHLYYGTRGGDFSAPVHMQTSASGTSSGFKQLQLRDVTGDGKPDLVIASSETGSFFVHPNDGSGGFLPANGYPYPDEVYLYPGAVEVMDVDRDGANEVIVASPCNDPCSNLYVYRRTSQGYLALSKTIRTYDNPSALAVHDVDQDGKQDLVVGHMGWDSVGRYMGLDDGLSTEEQLSSVPFKGISKALALGDLNRDGCTDIAVANTFGMSVLYGACVNKASSDFTGDSVSDLLWHKGSGESVIWASADSASSQAVTKVNDPAWAIRATGDFDGDGRSDMLWRNSSTGANVIWKSGSHATQQAVTGVTNLDWRIVGAGDFNGDGQSDVLWRNSSTGANAIWTSGSYATQLAVMGVTDLRWEVAGVGDVDGDGMADILWRHSKSGRNTVWMSGNYATQLPTTGVTDLRWEVAGIGDFNGDGKADIAWRHARSGRNVIWLSGNSSTPMDVTGVTKLAWSIGAVGDYDGDGQSDLFWRNAVTGANVIWRSADYTRQQRVASLAGRDWQVVK